MDIKQKGMCHTSNQEYISVWTHADTCMHPWGVSRHVLCGK